MSLMNAHIALIILVSVPVCLFLIMIAYVSSYEAMSRNRQKEAVEKSSEEINAEQAKWAERFTQSQKELEQTRRQAEEAKAELNKMSDKFRQNQEEAERARRQAEDTKAEQKKLNEELQESRQEHEQERRQAEQAMAEQMKLSLKLKETQEALEKASPQAEQTKIESAKLNDSLQAAKKEIQEKILQVAELTERLAGVDAKYNLSSEKAAELEKIEPELTDLQKSIHDQKKSAHQMKQRLEEVGIKMRLLDEKTKQSVELISRFAQGKEYDEFRKSIHMDEIIQKYEDQIQALRIENLELKKKQNG